MWGIPALLLGISGTLVAAEPSAEELAAGFRNPGNESRPRAYWNWLNGNVTPERLTRDLEEAKDKGLGGLEMWDTEAMRNPDGMIPAGPPFMGPESVAAMRHCMTEAKRLGLELGLITSSGWNAGGPWVPPAMASKNLFVTDQVVTGPAEIRAKLAFPEVPRNCPIGADGRPKWFLDVAVLAWPDTADKTIPELADIIDLTKQAPAGELRWTAPAGTWRIARFVCTNNGQQLIAASPNSKGPFIDFLDPAATRFHFEHIIGKLGLKRGGDPGCPLKSLAVDSMELHPGIQWTPAFPDWFDKHHGYDPVPWLPALAGWTIRDRDASERFQYDYRKTVSDLLIFSHYTTGSQVCAEYGLALAGEAGGPGPPVWDTCPVESLKALGNVDFPRGEFWIKHEGIFLVKEIASAAHIYGKPCVDAESWTTWRRWKDGPFVRKQLVDRAFCEGLNRITYHGYAHSPASAGYPGWTYHAGVDMNPQVVWWPKARPFMDYLARCCHLLRQGLFVADVAHYYGDQAPNFWPSHHQVPDKPLLPGLGAGYDYDVVNSDVILNRMTVKDGRLTLPDGMSYRVLTLPERGDMPLEVLAKLEQLVAAGATVIGPKPTAVPGLRDHAARGTELRVLADKLWGPCDGTAVTRHRYGQGTVVWGMTARQWLAGESAEPDFACTEASLQPHLDYIHRRTPAADIYFVRNQSLTTVRADCRFRVGNRAPRLWDPADGSIEPLPVYQPAGSGTRVPLDLPPGGAVFVVFGDPPEPGHLASLGRAAGAADPTLPAPRITARTPSAATLQCWQNGTYLLTDAKGRERRVSREDLPAPWIPAGGWTLAFDPKWGAPATIQLPELISWTDHADAGVKYYSGTGCYTKVLEIPADWLAADRQVTLDLGEVRELAEVHVNGKSAGVLWKPPFRVDLTPLVKPGANTLKIEVMNLWINRLSGDLDLPADRKFTRTNIKFDGYRPQPGSWQPQPSGLLGPVRLLPSARTVVPLSNEP